MAGLYPNIPFTDGSIFTPDLADLAMEAPIFDDQPQYKGHRVRILDSELSNNPGQIKDRVAKLTDTLKLSVVSGLTLGYTSGSVRLPDGAIQAIPANQIVVPDNATSYIWVNSAGQVAAGSVPPVSRVLLGKATAVSGTITSLEDLRSGAGIPEIRPVARAIRSFGGWGDQGDYIASNGDELDQGDYYFSSFVVPAGVSISVSKFAQINVSGDVVINGSLIVTPASTTGISAYYVVPPLSFQGNEPGAGIGGAYNERLRTTYSYLVYPVGSSGAAGTIYNFTNSQILVTVPDSLAGAGGGGLIIKAAGSILVSGNIFANGDNGAHYITAANYWIGGSGGGSGGLISLQSLSKISVSATAILSAKGGNGGKGMQSAVDGSQIEAGSGGGGGYIIIQAPEINTSGATMDVGGGNAGSLDPAPAGVAGLFGPGGAGGSFGGLGGHNTLVGSPGLPGIIKIQLFTPIG